MPSTMHPADYFAYGSNMSAARLGARIAGARCRGTAVLIGHQLRFHKIGRDGSGKCDAFHTGLARDRVHGVIYQLDPSAWPVLDDFEDIDVGYRRVEVDVEQNGSRRITAQTYLALRIDPSLRPFDWYRDHVLDGARAAGFPVEYIRMIEAVSCHVSVGA